MLLKSFCHNIDFKKVSEGLGLSVDRTKLLFNDGRIIGRLGEFILEENNIAKRCESESSSYDNISENSRRIEVRSITREVSFASSKEIGYGRNVTESGFKEKMDLVDYFYCVDFKDDVSDIEFILVPKEMITVMENDGLLGKTKSIRRKRFLKFINSFRKSHSDETF